MTTSSKVMIGEIPKLCLLIATLTLGSACGRRACERGQTWWDRERGECLACTRCERHLDLVVRLPCEPHRDTVCQPLQDTDWAWAFPQANDSDFDSEYNYDTDDEVNEDNSDLKLDAQVTALSLAASGCVIFFVVVLYLSFYHSKQWRALKQALKTDVQDLSAKLKLMEAGEAPTAEPVVATDHHIYCNIHVHKNNLIGSASKGSGNVYTQEKHST